MYYAIAVLTAVRSRVTRTMSIAQLLGTEKQKRSILLTGFVTTSKRGRSYQGVAVEDGAKEEVQEEMYKKKSKRK